MKVEPTTKQLIAMLYERLPELFDRELAPIQEPLTNQQHRENFEAWFRKEFHDRLDRNMPDKSYNSPHANATWIGWAAANGIKENT